MILKHYMIEVFNYKFIESETFNSNFLLKLILNYLFFTSIIYQYKIRNIFLIKI
jgi:hypothetical protein